MSKSSKPWFYKQTGWWMSWIGGRKVKLAKGKKNKGEAADRLAELLYQSRHNPAPGAPQTVASVIERYTSVAAKTLAASTLACRTPYLQSFAEEHGWRKVSDAIPHHMESWLLSHPEWESDWTKNGAVRNVQVAFNWAANKSKIIRENPFKGFSHRVGAPRRDMSPAEFRAILRATVSKTHRKRPTPGARFRQFLMFLWYTGCRPSEASKLTWSDVDFERNVIVLKEHKTARTQRTPAPRVIPLDPLVVRLLVSIRKRGEGERVFLNHRKTPWNRNSLVLRTSRARKAAGLSNDVKLYGTRHAFGTRGIMAGCNVKTLSAVMGHTTTRTTEIYVHLATQHEHLADAMLLINGRRRDG